MSTSIPDGAARPGPRRRARGLVRAVRRAVLARRRLLAALFAATAVLLGLRALTPPAVPTTSVWVAAGDLAAGTTLDADAVHAVTVPRDLVAGRVVTRPAGRVLAAPVAAGETLTETRLVGPALVEPAEDRVAVPVRLPDAGMAGLLRVGDRVDLLAADLQGGPHAEARVVADDVPVLALGPGTGDGSTPAPGGPGAGGVVGASGRLVVVGVRDWEVTRITQAAAARHVTFAWSVA